MEFAEMIRNAVGKRTSFEKQKSEKKILEFYHIPDVTEMRYQ